MTPLDISIFIIGVLSSFIIYVLTSPKFNKIKNADKEVLLIDEDIIEDIKSEFKDTIVHNNTPIDLLTEDIIQDVKDKFKAEVNLDFNRIDLIPSELITSIESSVQEQIKADIPVNAINNAIRDYTNASIDKYIENIIEANEVQNPVSYKLNTRTIYDIAPQKYLDLVEKEIIQCKFDNNILNYIGTLRIKINVQNSNEFWFMELNKNNTIKRYGFSIKQKKTIQELVAYSKYINSIKLDTIDEKQFKFIKAKIQGLSDDN